MERFTSAVFAASATENWYAALALALALPDICGFLEGQPRGPRRYIDWCTRYLTPRYTHLLGDEQVHVFLHAKDCYALRCALLHSGTDDITEQEARKVLERFVFVVPPNRGRIHCNQAGTTLQLQVDIFCQDICAGVREWEQANSARATEMEARTASLVTIREL